MPPRLFNLISIAFFLMLFACSTPQTNNATPTNSSMTSTPSSGATQTPEVVDPGFNILVGIEGDVQLKRSTWSNYHPTSFGAALQRGDLLKPDSGAAATILCDGLTVWQVPAGAPAGLTNGCPQPPDKILVSGSIGIAGTIRGANDPFIPYIISPRMTKILSQTPTLRWNDSGAASYNVQIRGGDLNWQQTEVTATELSYPGDPAFEPGDSYLLVVEDSNGNSSQDEGRAGLGFSLIGEVEAQKIRTDANRISALGLAGEAEAYAQAQFYAGRGLTAEAIEILEDLVAGGSQHVVVHQTLADLYAKIGLLLLAEPRYLEAVELAKSQGNLETTADIQANLAEIYVRFGNSDEATRYFAQAQASYETLGDQEKVDRITEELELLQ